MPPRSMSPAPARACSSSASAASCGSSFRAVWPDRLPIRRGAPLRITDAHIHIQPWDELKPEVLAVMTRSHDAGEVAELREIMKDPARLLRLMDAEGIERAVLVNYPSPDLMGFTNGVNAFVTDYCRAAPDRLVPMGGVHPRFAKDAAAEVRRAAAMGVRALKIHPPHMN